jgi:hypothetical protein
MFCTTRTLKKARKNHKCTYCGDPYYAWESVDDSWFHSKMHPECVDSLIENSYDTFDDTYEAYDNERPVGFDKFSDMIKFLVQL